MTGNDLDWPELPQRRAAFRVSVKLPVWIDQPDEQDCQLVDLSVLGARFDAELPCDPGYLSAFTLVTEEYGTVPITGEVVRVRNGETAVRFIQLGHEAQRAVTGIVNSEQRRKLQARVRVL